MSSLLKITSHFFRKYKIILIVTLGIFVVVALLWLLPTLFFLKFNPSKISYGTFSFDKSKDRLYLENKLLWDTGAGGSMIFEEYKDEMQHVKIPFGFLLVSDFFHKKHFQKLYYSSQFTLADSLNISNFCFLLIKEPMEELKSYTKKEIGFIGMDVIGKANWIIDFNSETIDILSQTQTYKTNESPQLIFEYNYHNNPIIRLDFSTCQLENIKIDAGSNCELTLLKSDIEQINEKHNPKDTLTGDSYGIHSTEPVVVNIYVYDSIMINGVIFNDVQIIEGTRKVLGFKFFKRFNKVFLNTKEKEFCFYE